MQHGADSTQGNLVERAQRCWVLLGAPQSRTRRGGYINKDGTHLAQQQESSGISRAKERDMEAKASKHASKREHVCARVRVCVCARRAGVLISGYIGCQTADT